MSQGERREDKSFSPVAFYSAVILALITGLLLGLTLISFKSKKRLPSAQAQTVQRNVTINCEHLPRCNIPQEVLNEMPWCGPYIHIATNGMCDFEQINYLDFWAVEKHEWPNLYRKACVLLKTIHGPLRLDNLPHLQAQ